MNSIHDREDPFWISSEQGRVIMDFIQARKTHHGFIRARCIHVRMFEGKSHASLLLVLKAHVL